MPETAIRAAFVSAPRRVEVRVTSAPAAADQSAVQAARGPRRRDRGRRGADTTRRAVARRVGADVSQPPGDATGERIRDAAGGLGADLVVECTGLPGLVQIGADRARRGGTLLLLGYPKRPSEVDTSSWMRRQLGVRAALGYRRQDFDLALQLIGDGRIDTSPLHTATVGLDALDAVLSDLADGRSGQVKVLVDPSR